MAVTTVTARASPGSSRRSTSIFPWPAIIVWLCIASRYADGWAGVGLIYAAIMIAAWRALKALPADGLKDDRQ